MVPSMRSKYKYGYICTWCGKVAFYTDTKPQRGETVRSELFFKPDGTQPAPGSQIICPICDRPILTMYTENIVELAVYFKRQPIV